jgi:hypothetical protein
MGRQSFDDEFRAATRAIRDEPVRRSRVRMAARRHRLIGLAALALGSILITVLLAGGVIFGKAVVDPEYNPPLVGRLHAQGGSERVSFGDYLRKKELSTAPYARSQLRRPGYLLTFDFRISGGKRRRLPMTWAVYNSRSMDLVDRSRDIAIFPDADEDRGSWDVWIPAPRRPGRYIVKITLFTERGLSLATITQTFVVPSQG